MFINRQGGHMHNRAILLQLPSNSQSVVSGSLIDEDLQCRRADTALGGLHRSVPPTGLRRTKILGQLRVHLRSVGRQIGPEALLDFVQEAIRQDKPYMKS